MPRALSQRASQKPSRPDSKATAIRLISCPDLIASSRQRNNSASSSSSLFPLVFNFLAGLRSSPGTIPPASQLSLLSSITATRVLLWSKGSQDLRVSKLFAMGEPRRCFVCDDAYPVRRSPHSISMTAPVASGGSEFAGRDLHPLESAAFARRTPIADLRADEFDVHTTSDSGNPPECAKICPPRL